MVVDYIQGKTDKWLESEAFPAFQALHPQVKVEPVYVSWAELDATVQGYFAAGQGADVLNLGAEYVAEYGDRLAPLNPYLGEGAWLELRQFVPATLQAVTWDGQLRGLPWLAAPRAYLCRTDLLQAAGLKKPPATFKEAVDEARRATIIENGAVKQAGIATAGRLDDWQEYLSLIWSLGGTLYKENGEPNFDAQEARDALRFMYDRRRAVYPDETIAGLPTATVSRLADGSAVCLWANLWGAPAAQEALWAKIEITPGLSDPENYPNSKPVVQVLSDWLAVPAYSKNQALAAELLKFLGSAQNLNRYNQDFGTIPPRQDAWTGYVAADAATQKMSSLMAAYGLGFADVRAAARLGEIMDRELPAYFTDRQGLETTLQNIQEQYTRALKEAGQLRARQ